MTKPADRNEREERLAAQLRANLKRRKAQARAMDDATLSEAEDGDARERSP
ncbi:hypothetical protein [Parapontixanthobacter aurantiacus]|uniref:hypothetical protein n=1 Tax=Parapontixanthobacter aurantiacus TaxID=1463599 RepID=UPI001928E124|nr:hypothetical protein [Parapontixanthobacter aurantiacus]